MEKWRGGEAEERGGETRVESVEERRARKTYRREVRDEHRTGDRLEKSTTTEVLLEFGRDGGKYCMHSNLSVISYESNSSFV